MRTSRIFLLGVLLAIVSAGFFGFTKSGHRALSALGFVAACEGGDCN